MNLNVRKVLNTLQSLRLYSQETERGLQDKIAERFHLAGIDFGREVKIGKRCRIDFITGDGIGVECKKGKPNRQQLEYQIKRYCGCESVKVLVMVIERSVFGHPDKLNGKRIYYIALNKQWGIAL